MENSSFFNAEKNSNGTYDRTYNAEDWAAYFSTFIGNGVSINPETCLQVEKTTGLNVLVNSGVAFINGYRYENTTPLTVKINEANASYDRITSIILELNLNTREILCKTLDGEAEQNPKAPSLTRTQSLYQLQLATVYIPAGGINCGVITDTRENKEVCGYLNLLAPPENNLNELSSILSGYYMGNKTAITGKFISDFDTTLESGYYSYATSMKTKNIPPNCDYGVLVVIVGSVEQGQISYNNLNNWIWQIAYDTSGIVTMRYAVDSGWSSWSVIANTANETFEGCKLTECKIDESVISASTIEGGVLKSIGLSGEISNYGDINGGKISNSTLDNVNIVGDVNNFTNIKGGNYSNPTLNEAILTGSVTLVGGTGIQGGAICNTTFSESINNEATINGGTYNEPTFISRTSVNGSLNIDNSKGILNFQNSQNKTMISLNSYNDTFQFKNAITNQNIFSLTPVSSGLDNVTVNSNIIANKDITINSQGGLHFKSNSNDTNYNIACGYYPNNNIFAIWNENNWSPLVEMSADNPNLINFNTKVNINNGLYVNNNKLITNEPGINGTVEVSPGVYVDYTIQYWTLSGGQLDGANSNMVQLGILQVTITPKKSYNWPNYNAIILSYSQIPNLGAQPLTQVTWNHNHTLYYQTPFTTSLQNGNIVLDGTGWTLNANQAYTMYALVFGDY